MNCKYNSYHNLSIMFYRRMAKCIFLVCGLETCTVKWWIRMSCVLASSVSEVLYICIIYVSYIYIYIYIYVCMYIYIYQNQLRAGFERFGGIIYIYMILHVLYIFIHVCVCVYRYIYV